MRPFGHDLTTYLFLDSCVEKNVYYYGETIDAIHENVENDGYCQELCADFWLCYFWSYNAEDKECVLKSSDSGREHFPGYISGPKKCGKLKFNIWKYRVFMYFQFKFLVNSSNASVQSTTGIGQIHLPF